MNLEHRVSAHGQAADRYAAGQSDGRDILAALSPRFDFVATDALS